MLDRAARSTARNFSTLFLVCLALFLPLEMAYASLHRNAIAVHELESFIRELDGNQRVQKVGNVELDDARRDRAILTAIEVALFPLLISATRRVIEREESGELPTATDALLYGPPQIGPAPEARTVPPILLAAVFSLCLGLATYYSGRLVVDLVPDRGAFVVSGTLQAVARSVSLPWLLGAWVEASRNRRRRRRGVGDPFATRPGSR